MTNATQRTEAKPKDAAADAAAIDLSLSTIDAEIRAHQGGEAGSGIYTLLQHMAGQFFGTPRSSGPVAEPAARAVDADEEENRGGRTPTTPSPHSGAGARR